LEYNKTFGTDFEKNIGNRDFNVINCHRSYLGEAAQKIDKRARSARLSGLRIRIRFLAALRAAYQAHGADVGRSEQARSSLRRSSAAPLYSRRRNQRKENQNAISDKKAKKID